MEKMEKLFNDIASSASEEMRKLSSTELVKLSREGDDIATSLLAKRVLPMAKSICFSKNCFIYGQAEVSEAFVHALMYGIHHFNVESQKAKFETAFKFYADSTYAQMHQTANAGKNKQLNTAANIDDVQFAIPDEHHETLEESVEIKGLIDLLRKTNWEPESLQETYAKQKELYEDKISELLLDYSIEDHALVNSLKQADNWWKRFENNYKKAVNSHRANMIKFIMAATDNIHTLSEEELCIELKLVKLKDTLRLSNDDRKDKEKVKEIKKQRQQEALNRLAEIVSSVGRGGEVSKGLLSRYGIICDKESLQVIQKDLKSFLEYIDFVDVQGYQLQVDNQTVQTLAEKAIERKLAAEAKERGKKLAEIKEAYKLGNVVLDFAEVVSKVKEQFIHSHPDTMIAMMAV